MPQSLHNSSGGESIFVATAIFDGGAVGGMTVASILLDVVVNAGVISVVDEDAIGVDEAGAISVVDEDATPELIADTRVEGRKTPHLLK